MFRTEKSREDELIQLEKYMDICGVKEGHLVLFDKSAEKNGMKKFIFKNIAIQFQYGE